MSWPLAGSAFLGLGPTLAAALALTAPGFRFDGYAPPSTLPDTIRLKRAATAPPSGEAVAGAVIPGYLSSWGLPPVQGQVLLTDTGLVFHASRGSAPTRASSLSLAYMDDENGRIHYVFRVDGSVFETDAPGPLLALAADSVWSAATRRGIRTPPIEPHPVKSLAAARQIASSRYADTLYTLFGRPRAGVGLIGRRGRIAGRLGEYISMRDSLALDPARMKGEVQLRHALAHELGHRWQARAKTQLAMLWLGVGSIRDPKRYGYGNLSEHQAEAIAFAISFLQATAGSPSGQDGAVALLDHYDLLVPGTRIMVRYLALQSPYRHHPLRSRLTSGRITYALEK